MDTDKSYHAVIYTDGSAQPNPGPYGGGAHGYLYTDDDFKKNNDKPNNYTITQRGYLEKHELKPEDQEVKPSFYYNAVYPYGTNGTNNRGELHSVIDTIEILAKDYPLKDILILTDSAYTISVFKAVTKLDESKWGTDRPNIELWHKLKDVLNQHQDINIQLDKVKGHGTAIGNNIADRLAYAAREMALTGLTEPVYKYYEGKYWKDKPTPHPLINFKQAYFNVNFIPDQDEYLYVIMDYPKDIEVGKKSPEPIFGISIFKEPIQEIEDPINLYKEKMNGMQILSNIHLAELYTQYHDKFKQLLNHHTYNFTKNKRLNIVDEVELITPIIPSGLAQNMLNRTLNYYKLYKRFKQTEQDPLLIKFDITDKIYELDRKGKLKCILENNTDKPLEIPVKLDNQEVTVKLILGLDTLTRNQFKRLETDNPKVTLVVQKISDKYYEYNIIVETDQASGIYGNYYVNKLYLK